MERVTGFGPALPAWRAGVLPLNYTRAKMEEGDIAVLAPPGVEPGDKRTRTTLAHLRGTVPRGLHCAELRGKGIGVPRKLRTYLLPIYRFPCARLARAARLPVLCGDLAGVTPLYLP